MYGKDSSGVGRPVLVDSSGALIKSGGGEYKKNTLNGAQYFANALAMEVALYTATSAIGLIIYNPTDSGVNMVPNIWSVIVDDTSASMTGIVLAVGTQLTLPATTTAAPLSGKSLLTASTGLTAGKCAAYSIATILAPVLVWPLFHNTAAIATTGAEVISGDLKGAFSFAPGTTCVMGALGAAGVNVNLAIGWEEIAV